MATINVAELTEAIKLVALVADRGAQVRMEFAEGMLRLSAGADDVGRAEEDLAVDFVGEPLTIAFNPTYLTDGLAVGPFGAGVVRFHDVRVSRRCCGRRSATTAPPDRQRAFRRLADGLRVPVDASSVARVGVRPAFGTA